MTAAPTEELALLEMEPEPDNTHLMSMSQFLLAFPDLKPPAFTHEFKQQQENKPEKERYNGQRIKRDRPDLYAYIVKCLADDKMSSRMITEITGVKFYVQRAIAFSEGLAIKVEKKVLSQKHACVSDLALDRMMEVIPDCTSLSQLAMTAGISTDKHILLEGGATGHVEHIHKIDFAGALKALHDEAQKKFEEMKTARATIVETAQLEES